MTESFEGGCSCGEVRFKLASRPMFTHCCHCLDCQKQTGGAFAINALIETARIEMLSGEPQKVEMPSPSGRGHDVYRCAACEVALWSDYGTQTEFVDGSRSTNTSGGGLLSLGMTIYF